jgi:hypothetical protein
MFHYISCDSTTDTDVLELIKELPEKHTILFIKEQLRCAVTLTPKSHIGVLYDRYSRSANDDVVVQGLAGRCTGYDNDAGMVVFTHIESIRRYAELVESNFDNIGSFKFHGSRSKGKPTFTHRSTYRNELHAPPPTADVPKDVSNRRHELFATQDAAIAYVWDTFRYRISRQPKAPATLCDADGANPTKEHVLKRWYGISSATKKKKKVRKVPLNTGEWMIYWEHSSLFD